MGVFFLEAPSTMAIILSRKVSPDSAVTRTTSQSEASEVPPVTALLSPPDSRITADNLIDLICANLVLESKDAQRILQETDVEKRLMITYEVLVSELEMLRIEQNIDAKVKSELDKNQREYVLREQIKVIQEELGEGDVIDEIEDYRERLEALEVSDEVRGLSGSGL